MGRWGITLAILGTLFALGGGIALWWLVLAALR
jgi:hypothetical protein